MTDPALVATAQAALRVAEGRAKVTLRMREALLRGDDAEALRCARILAGLEEGVDDGEPSNCTRARFQRGAGRSR